MAAWGESFFFCEGCPTLWLHTHSNIDNTDCTNWYNLKMDMDLWWGDIWGKSCGGVLGRGGYGKGTFYTCMNCKKNE